MADLLSITSMNCRGLHGDEKRRDVFDYLRALNSNIYCLQDTHLKHTEEFIIRSQWGYECVVGGCRSDARGVAILFNSNFTLNVVKTEADPGGNWIVVKIIINDSSVVLANVYGPNADDPLFYENLQSKLSEFEGDHLIACGDWNLVQNFLVDCRNYKRQNNRKSSEAVMNMKSILSLVDPWRATYPELRRYTWFKRNPCISARLDFFLMSDHLMNCVEKTDILPGYRTDHSITQLKLRFSNFTRGTGYWKFNNALLRNKEFVDKVKECINQVMLEYALPVYNIEAINQVARENLQFVIDDQMFFEMILLKIRGTSIALSARLKKDRNSRENFIEKELANLQEKIDNAALVNLLESLNNKKDNLNQELESLRADRMQGVLVRSKSRWIEYGEKPSKYFCSLEKRNFVSKNITYLSIDGTDVREQNKILQNIQDFYSSLYSHRETDIAELDSLIEGNPPKLSDVQSKEIDNEIQISELGETLKRMKNGKSPGPDGFTTEFFKFFWADLKVFYHRSINEGIMKQKLSVTQRQGIICMIPKGNKPRQFLTNWRPISLLNVTYKILSGSIANRIKKHLSGLIHKDQRGFLPGRFIGDNVRLLYDLMDCLEKKDIPGLLLLIDFEKAFDSVSWNFIAEVLRFFNFGPFVRLLVDILMKEASLRISQFGFLSDSFSIGRGCRQGDPISPYLFLLCAEILAHLVRQDNNIKGIKINDQHFRLCQYADDTMFFLDGSSHSLLNALRLLDQFAKFSGLKPNISKTVAVWLGSKRNSDDIVSGDLKLTWSKAPFRVLGIMFSTDLPSMITINFENKLREMRRLIETWSKRHLSVIGKITVVKSIILPVMAHLFVSLPNPDSSFLKSLEQLLFKFIWNNKNDRVSRNLLVQHYGDGGLMMTHLSSFVSSLKVKWIRRLLFDHAPWIGLFPNLFSSKVPASSDRIVLYGPDYLKTLIRSTNNFFWKDVLSALHSFRSLQLSNFNGLSIDLEPLWFSDKIYVGGNSIYYEKWARAGINFVEQMIKEGQFITYTDFCDQFFPVDFTVFYGLKNSILKAKLVGNRPPLTFPHCPQYVLYFLKPKNSQIYRSFLKSVNYRTSYQLKWEVELGETINAKHWKTINTVVNFPHDTKLRWFQYRLIHRILSTKSFLYKIKLSDSDLCSYCNKEPETLYHLFIQCEIVTDFRKQLYEHFSPLTDSLLMNSIAIFSSSSKQHITLLLLLLNFFIYRQKFTGVLSNELFIKYIKERSKHESNSEIYNSVIAMCN